MSEKMTFLPKKELLTLEELDFLCTAFIDLGIDKLRITGGEPLVRKNILTFFENLSRHLVSGKLKELVLTTNGTQLEKFAQPLKDLGVKRINVSLDTLSPKKFTKITRWGNLEKVLNGISAAKKAGLSIKINTVALKGTNDNEIHDFISWCGDEGFDITFIEVMPMGMFNDEDRLSQYWTLKELRNDLDRRWTLTDSSLSTGGPAKYVHIKETDTIVGFITPLSNNFCAGCNRVRLTCTGQLFTCLGQEGVTDLRSTIRATPGDISEIQKAIEAAIKTKPLGHDFNYSNQKIKGQMSRFMSHTGG